MAIRYSQTKDIALQDIIEVFNSSGINRPTQEPERIQAMFARADLIISCWDEEELIGIARSLTDFCYCCYLSDLAVKASYQGQGIGKELVARTRAAIGQQTMLLLVAATSAVNYYPKLGMAPLDRAFMYPRES